MILIATVAALVAAPAAHAETYTVMTNADVSGVCDGTACTSIRQALTSAFGNPGRDTIVVPEGTYDLTLGALQISSEVTLAGAGARTTSIVGNENRQSRVLEINSTSASVSGVTLRGGSATDVGGFHGGTVRSQSSTVELDRVRVTDGLAYSGGGVANRNGSMLIQNSLIDSSSATLGGGDGGGILNFGGDGGASAQLTVRNSTIAFNTARLAGGIISYGHQLDSVTLSGVTVAHNTATDRGVGGVALPATGAFRIGSSIVADNFVASNTWNCGGPVPISDGYNVESGLDCGFTQPTDVRDVDAGLSGELENRGGDTDVVPTFNDSPAVNLIPSQCLPADQRGVQRPQGSSCDAGAFELQYTILIDSGPDGVTNDNRPKFTFSSALATNFRCRLNGPGDTMGEYAPCNAGTWQAPTALADETYWFQVAALIDGQEIDDASRSFTVDTTKPPAPQIETPAADSVHASTSVPVSGTGETFTTITIKVGDRVVGSTHVNETGFWDATADDLTEGTNVLSVTATDEAGNVSDPRTRTIRVDTPPVATITSGPPVISNNVHPQFTFTSSEPAPRFQCRDYIPADPPGNFVDCDSPHTVRDVTDGQHIFEVRALDAAGTPGEPDSYSFTVDTVAPTQPTITEPDDGTVLREGGVFLQGQTDQMTSVDIYDNGAFFAPAMIVSESNGGWFLEIADLAPGTHVFTAIAKDAAGNVTQPSAPVTVYLHPNGPTAAIQGPALTNDDTPTFTLSANEPNVSFACEFASATIDCEMGTVTLGPLPDGTHVLRVRAIGGDGYEGAMVSREFVVDRTPPPAPQVSGTPSGDAVTFTVSAGEEGVALECRLEGPGRADPFAPCPAQPSYSGLAPGAYRFVVRASDGAGNVSTETVREFTVAQVNPQITPTPTPTATPTPQPEFRETAVARPVRGKVLVRRPGSNEFVELDGSQSIPMGSTIDAKRGRVRITAETQQGKAPQRAEFYDGIFRITQTRTLVDLKLVEALDCSSRRNASAAQRKPKKRKLWGSGKGRFRTTGSYSAATVRGTTWLVEDTCTTTLTRVTAGVVAVRDKRLKKTVLVRKGKRYTARAGR